MLACTGRLSSRREPPLSLIKIVPLSRGLLVFAKEREIEANIFLFLCLKERDIEGEERAGGLALR